MQNMKHNLLLDLDGTLYNFDGKEGGVFHSSTFYKDLRKSIITFIKERKKLNTLAAEKELERIHVKYNGEISIGVENEYGIDTITYFGNTWNLDPKKYIIKDDTLSKLLAVYRGRITLLTAAPSAWAIQALDHLEITEMFDEKIYTGESLLRKPNPLIFQKIVDDAGIPADEFISIGDQEYSDIAPAKSIGMKTMLIGKLENSVADYQANNIFDAIELLRSEGVI